MYQEQDRMALLKQMEEFVLSNEELEGLLQIGSGAMGFLDIYSDIDLMAGCFCREGVARVCEDLLHFFEELGTVYIDRRRWSEEVLGLSAYFENGLSVDISFMPTELVPIRSNNWRILISKSEYFETHICSAAKRVGDNIVDDSIHHKVIYALRRCKIALLRGEVIYADMALSESRQMLLLVEAAREGKKGHQFKAYNTLNEGFLKELEATYPASRSAGHIRMAMENLLTLYLRTVEQCDFLTFDDVQLKLLLCFS